MGNELVGNPGEGAQGIDLMEGTMDSSLSLCHADSLSLSNCVVHAAVKAVSFTGGTATGATVATVAAPHFKKISLELGGKNPAIILADADLGACVTAVLYCAVFCFSH
mgnify:CR=1 FL=1